MVDFFIRYRRIIIFIIAVVAFFWLVWALRNVLLPFILGIILAYLIFPVITWIEKKLPLRDRWKGAKRVFLIVLIFILFIAIIGGIGFLTIPAIISSVTEFFSNLPQIILDIIERFQDWTNTLREQLPPQIRDQVDSFLSSFIDTIGSALQSAFLAAISIVTANFGLILGFAALPQYFFSSF